MTQEKFSLFLLILKIHTQLLLLVPFNTLGRQVLLVMDWVPFPKGTWIAWTHSGCFWEWDGFEGSCPSGSCKSWFCLQPGLRAQRFCECFLSPIPDASDAFTPQGDQNRCLHPSECSTGWHFLPCTPAADSPPARQDLQSWHVLPVGGSAPCSTFIPPGTLSLKYLLCMAGEEHRSVITCSQSKCKVLKKAFAGWLRNKNYCVLSSKNSKALITEGFFSILWPTKSQGWPISSHYD